MARSDRQADLLDHPAERTVLTSYRSAMAGYDLGDPSCWDELWINLVNEGGVDLACRISGRLHYFVRSLRAARGGRLKYFPVACKRACADECLMLSLLSASQHGMAPTLEFCLRHLMPEIDTELRDAAQLLSSELTQTGLTLLPVPLSVIQSIVPETCGSCLIAQTCKGSA
jgi:hypothetical protein